MSATKAEEGKGGGQTRQPVDGVVLIEGSVVYLYVTAIPRYTTNNSVRVFGLSSVVPLPSADVILAVTISVMTFCESPEPESGETMTKRTVRVAVQVDSVSPRQSPPLSGFSGLYTSVRLLLARRRGTWRPTPATRPSSGGAVARRCRLG
jgi:hypothetical protein